MAEVTMEEMEEQTKEAAVPEVKKLADLKIEASDVPDHLKGATVESLVEQNRRLQESLKISEDARTALKGAADRIPDRREEVAEDPDDKITREEFDELLKTDPAKALEIYDRRLTKRLSQHFEDRFRPLVAGGVSAQEARAREKYKTEFELFGDQINKIRDNVQAQNPSALTNEAWWKDAVSYVRGLDENIDKFIQHKNGKTVTVAREEQRATTGFTAPPASRSPVGAAVDDYGLDEVQKKIAETQNPGLPKHKAWAEYKKWAMTTE